ncbi:MAG: 30S ribosomal protein S18 [Actinomycetota bacterium]|nr:MAG: 30S ribosomal protein S18 [Actinomycetota bacterium]
MAKEVVRKGGKKKVCIFCVKQIDTITYKDVDVLRKYMSDRGKIRARRVSGNCSQHQRSVAVAIKTARELALLPYTQRTVAERTSGGRGGPRTVAPSAVEHEVSDAPIGDIDDLALVEEFEESDATEEKAEESE